jgi:ribonuclease Z
VTLRVTFLGTGGAVPTVQRNVPAVYVNREGDELLFDCGEGTQRQMMRYGTGFSVDHVFLTHTHGDHVLGLPGLLQTLDFNEREAPLAVHTPRGTRSTVESVAGTGGTNPAFAVRVHEVSPGETALTREEYEVRAVDTDHDTRAVGYALVEDDRKGRFDRQTAEEELGIPPGPKYSKLHRGEAVEHDGRTVEPEEVVGPARPGRRVVYTGDTRPVDAVVRAAEGADLLIHDATFADDRAERAGWTAHSTAREAAEVAARAGAKRLALVHVSSRYAADVSGHARQASEELGERDASCEAFVPDDGDELAVPFPDSEG